VVPALVADVNRPVTIVMDGPGSFERFAEMLAASERRLASGASVIDGAEADRQIRRCRRELLEAEHVARAALREGK
jgi:predicted kinase